MISDYKIILASNSPRRKELLSGLDIDYQVLVIPDIDESYPSHIQKDQIAEYLAQKKASVYKSVLEDDTLVITADTVVIQNDIIYGKPTDAADAKAMLRALSGKTHQVITGVSLLAKSKQKTFSVSSDVRFARLDESDIDYYVNKYKPFDKAGSYGIQEWIGYIAVEYISGSYFNIMGLPVQQLYQELKLF